MTSKKIKNKIKLHIENKIKNSNSDERRQYITLNASIISIWYIFIYSIIEIVYKIMLSKTFDSCIIDIVRLVTTIFIYIFFVIDNKFFQFISDNSEKKTIFQKAKILLFGKKDERQHKILGISAAFVFFYTFLFLIIEILYKIINNNIDMIWLDYILFISMIVVYNISMKKDESYGLPTNAQGEILDKKSKKEATQRKILYIKQSITYMVEIYIIGIIMSILSGGKLSLVPWEDNFKLKSIDNIYYIIKMFVFEFIVILLFNFIYGEYKVKKYHKKLERMEE